MDIDDRKTSPAEWDGGIGLRPTPFLYINSEFIRTSGFYFSIPAAILHIHF